MVDRVSRVSPHDDGNAAKLLIDVDDLFAAVARLRPDPVAASPTAAPAHVRRATLSARTMPADRLATSALAVSTGSAMPYLALDNLAAVSDALSVIAVPDPRPALIGLAIHAGTAIPVLRLTELLGMPPEPGEDSGAVVLTGTEGACAVVVRKVMGLVSAIERDRQVDLMPLVRPFLDESTKLAKISQSSARVEENARYLLVEISGQFCAFRLTEVVRVQGQGASVHLPGRWSNASGLSNVDGAVLPLLDAGRIAGLGPCEHPGAHVVLTDSGIGSFVVPVHRLVRIVALANAGVREVGEDTGLAAIGSHDERSVWIFSSALLADRIGRKRHAA
jgi:chemotaxis signal transduction protein